jgi:outer membrane biosynthesis protein TonB
MRQSRGAFRRCYEEHLPCCPNLQSRVTVRFVIGRDGSVTQAADAGSDMPDGRIVACVVRAVSALHFPPPKGGPLTVTYPLSFSPGD